MRYTLLLHYPEMTESQLGSDAMTQGRKAFAAYADALHAAGVLLSAEVLQPSANTTTVSATTGTVHVQDGPYADSKEQLGGSFVLDVPDLDTALEWAKQAPSVGWGPVEVRPSATHYADGAWRGAE